MHAASGDQVAERNLQLLRLGLIVGIFVVFIIFIIMLARGSQRALISAQQCFGVRQRSRAASIPSIRAVQLSWRRREERDAEAAGPCVGRSVCEAEVHGLKGGVCLKPVRLNARSLSSHAPIRSRWLSLALASWMWAPFRPSLARKSLPRDSGSVDSESQSLVLSDHDHVCKVDQHNPLALAQARTAVFRVFPGSNAGQRPAAASSFLAVNHWHDRDSDHQSHDVRESV